MGWVLLQSFLWHSYTKYCFLYFEHLHMVSTTIIHAIDYTTYRQDGQVVYSAGLRKQSLWLRWFESHSCHFVDIPIQSIVSFFLNRFPVFWTPAHDIFYHPACYRLHNIQAGWPTGLRRWFKALVTRVALVGVPLLSFSWHSYTKSYFLYFEHLHMVSSTIIHAIDLKTYRQDGREVWGAGLKYQSLQWRGFKS